MGKIFQILIADDDNDWTRTCLKHGRQVKDAYLHVSHSVEEALKKVHEIVFDLIFCDYRMQYQDTRKVTQWNGGFLICSNAKTWLSQVKVVMVTGYGSAELARESLVTEGFDDFIEKEDYAVDGKRIADYIQKFILDWYQRQISPNPFHVQRGQLPKHPIQRFRQNDLEFFSECIEMAINGQQTRFLVSGRVGSGKSSLLARYRNYAQKHGFPVSYFEIPPHLFSRPTEIALLELTQGILLNLPHVGVLDLSRFSQFFKSLSAKFDALGIKIELSSQFQERADLSMRDQLSKSVARFESRSDALVIFLDNIPNQIPVPEALKCLLYFLAENEFISQPLVLGASLVVRGPEGFGRPPSIDPCLNRIFSGSIINLYNFSKEQIDELLLKTLISTGVTFDQKLNKKIFEYSGGQPFVTQLLCHQLYDSQIGGWVGEDVFRNVVQHCAPQVCAHLRDSSGTLNADEETILLCIASSEAPLDLESLRQVLFEQRRDQLLVNSVGVLNCLVERNILKRNPGNTYQIVFS